MKGNRFLEQLKAALAPQGKIERPSWGKIFLVIAVGIALTCLAIYTSAFFVGSPLPISLKDAGLVGEIHWSKDQFETASKITYRQLGQIEAALSEADKKGDAAAAIQLFNPMIEIMRAWNFQAEAGSMGRYRSCQLAAAHLSDGVAAVSSGQRYVRDTRFRASLDDCEP